MTFIIISLIVALLGGIVTLFFSSEMVGELYTTVFDCGQYLTTVSGVEFFSLAHAGFIRLRDKPDNPQIPEESL